MIDALNASDYRAAVAIGRVMVSKGMTTGQAVVASEAYDVSNALHAET